MTTKPRPLSNNQRAYLEDAEGHLTRSERLIRPIADGETKLPREAEFLASKARAEISEARRLLEKTLRSGTGPLKESGE